MIEPGGYMATWCRNNGAEAALRRLYRSASTVEAAWGNKAQKQSGEAQLIPNRFQVVGMSMGPPLDRQLRPDLHAEPEAGREDARLLDADPGERGPGDRREPHRPGSLRRLSILAARPLSRDATRLHPGEAGSGPRAVPDA